MRRIIISVILVLSYAGSMAQYSNKFWLIGQDPVLLEFKNDTTENKRQTNFFSYQTSNQWAQSNISDSINLLFSCNGYTMLDFEGQVMENGTYLMPNKFIDDRVYTAGLSSLQQQSIIIPKSSTEYYVFIWGMSNKLWDSIDNGLVSWRYDILTYSIVDLSYNNGKGKVISKENYLLQDTKLAGSQMSAVKHANGKDWWLLKPYELGHKYFTFLVTSEGIKEQPLQILNNSNKVNGVQGQTTFSRDGSLFAQTAVGVAGATQVNYFDRCSGKMTNYVSIPFLYDSLLNGYYEINGVCFSPNNQFLYLVNDVSIFQYELGTGEFYKYNLDTLSKLVGYRLPYLGIDDKIYIGNFYKHNALSYIEFPNKIGADANFCRLCYKTVNQNATSPPNNPNYELGALKGSPCDTIKPVITYEQISIYPNPVKDVLNVQLPSAAKQYELVVYNAIGQVVLRRREESVIQSKLSINMQGVASGVYTIRVITELNTYRSKFLKR